MERTRTLRAEVVLPSLDFQGDIAFFTREFGMRMDMIFPADDPSVAVLSGAGVTIRLERGSGAPGHVRLIADAGHLPADGTSPGGTRITVHPRNPPLEIPMPQHEFVVRRLADQAPWVIGRAGMQYRDLIPSRLGGSIIASHIRIPDGGPVPDVVHFHKVGFQLIFCYRGWVDVVYEDQGGPIRLHAGDCFIQPPEIRHRVLEASDGIEVIEIGVPADHVTEIDHEMTLPTPDLRPNRRWSGQTFVHNRASEGDWRPAARQGFEARDTTIAENTRGVAGVEVLRRGAGDPAWQSHDANLHFCFVMEGQMTLEGAGQAPVGLVAGDAFALPPGLDARFAAPSDDILLLEVMLPGQTG